MQKSRKIKNVDEGLVVQLVKRVRQQHPRLGGRKTLFLIKDDLREAGVSVGRDKFFDILERNDLLVAPLPKSPKTTNSDHSLEIFRNLVKEEGEEVPNKVWVSDITYIRTENEFMYLSLIMDRTSRKIVGFNCGDSLESEGCVKALDKALAELPDGNNPIHHSDRGCQYCCHEYVARLKEHGLDISMTEENHCAENSHAERLNGILKQEYGLGMTFNNKSHAQKAVEQAVWLYNNRRPHNKLDMSCPAEVHAKAA